MKVLSDKINVIIVNYNGGNYLLDCLSSLEIASEKMDLEIWVVDNNSTDDSLEKAQTRFKNVNFIQNKQNLGFGTANNIALRRVDSEYILLLNPDTKVSAETLIYMRDFLEKNPDVGAATCKVETASGAMDWASHRGFPTPFASFLYYVFKNDSLYHLRNRDMKKAHEVDSISGAFFMTRKSVLKKVGLFDEDYFLYAEDIDLCFRIKKEGFKVMFVPDVVVLHHKGITSGIKKHSQEVSLAEEQSRKRALDSFYETMKIFYKKHMAKNYPGIINWLVCTGIDVKWFLAKRSMSV